ncbi:alpha/beta hydrolase [Phytoactinopolyspora alkaliphila]|uniref:Alpha/beta hydrolase n=1 Tax=Phytoactinopolyspora alkaliphila TaxID=1783498 RepID=A0A6N9YHM8_9ACTN|nr:alpha/beta hydrolase [Phytoactinopolyspora alkaliphila]
MGGLALRDHWFDVPLDHGAPDGETIRVYAREVASASSVDDENMPWLVFFQGGPGGKSPRPTGATGWIGRAVEDFRVLLLDQRGTGRSTPITARTILTRGGVPEQAAYLSHFRADSIVADAELIRRTLMGDRPWSILGQSFGGFCSLTYLSLAPDHLSAAYITGGLGPIQNSADDVYRVTYGHVREKNAAFHAAYPQARDTLEAVADLLRKGDVRLPDGSPLSVQRLQTLGMAFGSRIGTPPIHYLFEEAFADGPGGRELSETFLHGVQAQVSYAGRPLFAVLHEPCYAQGAATRWAAHRLRPPDFDPDAAPLLFTGEMIYPWMFEEDPALTPFAEAAELLAERSDWPALYDVGQLRRNEVPVAAALYTDDMYVDAGFSEVTAREVRGARVWKTNAYEHDGLRETDNVLDRLIRMVRGEL